MTRSAPDFEAKERASSSLVGGRAPLEKLFRGLLRFCAEVLVKTINRGPESLVDVLAEALKFFLIDSGGYLKRQDKNLSGFRGQRKICCEEGEEARKANRLQSEKRGQFCSEKES